MQSLEDILESIWSRLAAALEDPASPLRVPVVATASADGVPGARAMVLRAINQQQGQVVLFSDRRGRKVEDLSANPLAELVFYDPTAQGEDRTQYRMSGAVTLARDADAQAIWDELPWTQKLLYSATPAPGSTIPEPSSGLSDALFGPDLSEAEKHAHLQDGFANFSVITIQIEQIDWLLITPDGNRAARYHRDKTGNWHSSWRIP